MRGMRTGHRAANAARVAGAATTAYGLSRSGKDKLKKNIEKKDNSRSYNGALVGAGTTGAVAAHGSAKFMDSKQKKFAAQASGNVDRAGKLIPAIAGRQTQEAHREAEVREKHFGVKPDLKQTMYPSVSDGQIGRENLMRGKSKKVAAEAGRLRGAAAQERHFAEVYRNTAKVSRSVRTPSAIVAAAGAGGLLASRDKVKKNHKPDPDMDPVYGDEGFAKRAMSDTEIRHRKKVQAGVSQAGGVLGLTALGGTLAASRGGRTALRKIPQLKPHIKAPAPKDPNRDRIQGAVTPVLATSAGLGGLGAFNFAAYTKAESRKRKAAVPKEPMKKNMPKKKLTRGNIAVLGATGVGGTTYGVLAHENRQKKIQRRAKAAAELENMVLKKNHKPEPDMDSVYGDEGIAKNWSPSSSKYDPEQKRHKRNAQAAAGTTAATGVAGAAAYNEQRQSGKLFRMSDARNMEAGRIQEKATKAKKAKKAYKADWQHGLNTHVQSRNLHRAGQARNARSGKLAVLTAGLGGTAIGLEAKRRSDGWKSYR